MEEYPGAEMSLSQLVHALEKRVSLMMNRSLSDAILYEDEIDRVLPILMSISTDVRQLKNSFSPINRLPPEVLALVLTFRKHERDLINATAVCKHWRRTFISTPNLWNNITCSGQESPQVIVPRTQAYLERSGSVPIDVQIPTHASGLFSSHTERISSLRMFLGHSSNLDEVAEHLSKPAPLLETITFHVTDWDRPTLVLPPAFFEVFLSSARTLTVHGATLSPGPCKLSRLTKFTLNTRVAGISSTALLETLEQMPLLQVFEAEFDCASRWAPVPINSVVTLPHLEEVTTTTDDHFYPPIRNDIIPALCLPSARRVSVRSVNALDFIHAPILPLSFEERLPGLSATPRVSVTFAEGLNIELFGSHESKLTLSTRPFADFTFTRLTFGGTPFGSVRELHVRFQRYNVGLEFFFGMLRAVDRLDCLEMEQNTVEPLSRWATEDDQAGICPALTTLTVADADFDKAKHCVRGLEQVRSYAGVPIARAVVGCVRSCAVSPR